MRWFKKRSLQVLLVVALYLSIAPLLPLEVHRGLYAISLLIKDLLLWMLPVTVGLFIAHAIASFEKKAPLFICSLLFFEFLSNFISVWYAFGCAHLSVGHLSGIEPEHVVASFDPLWRLPLFKPAWWSADKGTLIGVFAGLLAVFRWDRLKQGLLQGKGIAEKVLTRVFSRLIPLFILGFVARLYQTQVFQQMIGQYADLLMWLFVYLMGYIILLFVAGSGLSLKSIRNLLPAAGMAFSSGCSLSTMPWTIEGTAKNLDDKELASSVIPATTNIQQIGDVIVQAFLCFSIYLHFNGHVPPLSVWAPFALVFVLSRFATAAVLGGAIFVMLPIYESYLGFTPEMIAIILAFNVILDPLITCANVVANGALCRLFERVWQRVWQRVEGK